MVIANLDDQVAAVFRLSTRDAEDDRDRADDGGSSSDDRMIAGADATARDAPRAEADDAKLDDAALPVWLL